MAFSGSQGSQTEINPESRNNRYAADICFSPQIEIDIDLNTLLRVCTFPCLPTHQS